MGDALQIREWPAEDRPRERLYHKGAEALASYRAAGAAAGEAAQASDPAGPKLVVATRFAEASALIVPGLAREFSRRISGHYIVVSQRLAEEIE